MTRAQKVFLAASVSVLAAYGGLVAFRLIRRAQTNKSVVTPEQALAIIQANG